MIFPTETEFQGDTVDCIRVRETQPAKKDDGPLPAGVTAEPEPHDEPSGEQSAEDFLASMKT